MSGVRLTVALYLHSGVRSSTLYGQPTDSREDMIQLATWLANAAIGTAVVQARDDGTRPIHVARHPKAHRPLQAGAQRDANGRQVRPDRPAAATIRRRDELARVAGRNRQARSPNPPR